MVGGIPSVFEMTEDQFLHSFPLHGNISLTYCQQIDNNKIEDSDKTYLYNHS